MHLRFGYFLGFFALVSASTGVAGDYYEYKGYFESASVTDIPPFKQRSVYRGECALSNGAIEKTFALAVKPLEEIEDIYFRTEIMRFSAQETFEAFYSDLKKYPENYTPIKPGESRPYYQFYEGSSPFGGVLKIIYYALRGAGNKLYVRLEKVKPWVGGVFKEFDGYCVFEAENILSDVNIPSH